MRGGKRKGSGRKRKDATKVIRVPEYLVDEIKAFVEKRKKDKLTTEKSNKYQIPMPTKEQTVKLQSVMIDFRYAKSKTQARKMTSTPKKCREVFLNIVHELSDEQYSQLGNITELYRVD